MIWNANEPEYVKIVQLGLSSIESTEDTFLARSLTIAGHLNVRSSFNEYKFSCSW